MPLAGCMNPGKSVVSPHLFAYLSMKITGDLFGSFQLEQYVLSAHFMKGSFVGSYIQNSNMYDLLC